jgi:hypothetical protein
VDQTGVFSNELIVVAGGNNNSIEIRKGVWRLDAQGHATLLTNLIAKHLEGVITLPNDSNAWGPWAGKILTGDEDTRTIYAIASDGTTTTNSLGIDPEDFDLIPDSQDLYCVDVNNHRILRLSNLYFSNHVGKLLITDAGEISLQGGKLFVVQWNGASFVTNSIPHPSGDTFEHVTFAPIALPTLTP